VKYVCKPNYQKLGPKLGKDINNLKNHLDSLDQADITNSIKEGFLTFNNEKIPLDDLDLQLVEIEDKKNQDIVNNFLISLDTEIDSELLEERLSREVVSLVQKMRKDSGYDITDRITTTIFSSDDILLSAIDKHKEYIMNETLSVTLNSVNKAGQESLLDFSLTVEMSKS
jgi:isoleucyl-tRNA synthetase